MIAELILTSIIGGIIGFLIFYFKKKYEDKKILKDIPEKLNKQKAKFFADGKELSIFEKEVKTSVSTNEPDKPKKKVTPKKKPNTKKNKKSLTPKIGKLPGTKKTTNKKK